MPGEQRRAVHDNVVVYTYSGVNQDKHRRNGTEARIATLYYVVENSGLQAVTFRADFSDSLAIQLKLPQSATSESLSSEMKFECTVFPFERRVLVTVEKQPQERRAMIRVVYEVVNVFEPAIEDIERSHQLHYQEFRDLKAASEACYEPIIQRDVRQDMSNCSELVDAFCIDLNKYFLQHGERWIDSLLNQDDCKFEKNSVRSISTISLSMCTWTHLHSLCDQGMWSLFKAPRQKPATEEPGVDGGIVTTTMFRSEIIGTQAFSSALLTLSSNLEQWKKIWFPHWVLELRSLVDLKENATAVPVRLCENGVRWVTIVIDLFVPSFPLGNGIVAPRTAEGELWPALLYKAYAKLKGGYSILADFSVVEILPELTGVPCVSIYQPKGGVSGERKLYRRLEQALTRRHQISDRLQNARPIFVVAFQATAKVGNLLLDLARESSMDMSYVTLTDVDATLKQAIHDDPAIGNANIDRSNIRIPWSTFVGLKPHVWTLLPAVQHIRLSRQVYWNRDYDTNEHDWKPAVMLAISTATITTIAATGLLKSRSASRICLPASKLEIHIRRYDADKLNLHVESSSREYDASFEEHDHSQISAKVATTLSPGEYIVGIRVVGDDEQSRSQQKQDNIQATEQTMDAVEANLALIFSCLDQQMRGYLDTDDLEALLRRHEGFGAFEQETIELLRANFIARFGSLVKPFTNRFGYEKDGPLTHGLTVEDLGDVYRFLARIQSTITRQSESQILRELVWQDLHALLQPQLDGKSNVYERSGVNDLQTVFVEDIMELVCSIASDSPLVGCISLPLSTSKHLWLD